jgi:hypothetical protein
MRSGALAMIVFMIPGLLYGQIRNVRIDTPGTNQPEEVSIAINPVDPMNIAAGSNLDYYYYSTDGGNTWQQGRLQSTWGVWGDPCVIYDSKGNLYYGHLSRGIGGYFLDRIIVQKSTDGGATWNSGAGVGYNPPVRQQDKEWLAADLTDSPYHDNLYVAWTQFDSYGSTDPKDSSRILFSRSTDGGINWSVPQRVSDRAGDCLDSDSTVEGAVPAVGPNGEVYLSWSGPLGIVFDKSLDGGETFGRDVLVTSQPGGWDFDVSGIYRANGMPITACDISNSSHRGTIYVCWSDQRNGADNTDIFLVRSLDGGASWSVPTRVNDDTTATQQFFVWMTIDQSTGYLYFVFYDRRGTVGDATDVYCGRSTDGGQTFANFKVSDSSFTPINGTFFGDYINIAAAGGRVYPIWMRLDTTRLSVWTAPIRETTGIAEEVAGESSFRLSQNYPNPFNPTTNIKYTIAGTGGLGLGTSNTGAGDAGAGVSGLGTSKTSLIVYDLLGREVAVLVNETKAPGSYEVRFDASGLASGVYYYRLAAGGFTQTRKMILVR